MQSISLGDITIWRFNNLSQYSEVKHFVSTRTHGFSRPPYDSLNLAFHVGDDSSAVLRNRALLARSLDIPVSWFVVGEQVHGSAVYVASEDDRGRGATNHEDAVPGIDALVTNKPNICLMVLTADCVPVLIYDPQNHAAAAVHAGRKGTILGITRKTVDAMRREFGCRSEDLVVGIGPSIGPCCYRVGPDAVEEFRQALGSSDGLLDVDPSDGCALLNLWKANEKQLVEAGVHPDRIEKAQTCTHCHTDLFYSARGSGGTTGRFGTGICLAG